MANRPLNPLVLIRPGFIVNRSTVTKAERCGNCTYVYIGQTVHMEWDEDFSLWNRLLGIEPTKEETPE